MHDQQPLVVLVTAPSEAAALDLGRTLVDERLAACVNVVPRLTSIYELHPYTVPEVLGLPVAEGAPAYVQWVRESIPVEGG